MAVKYGTFVMPTSIIINEDKNRPNFAQVVAEPYGQTLGHTVGNSMRRVLLTCLEAPAIVSIRIEGVPHEFMAIEGISEDMTNIILNLKGAKLRKLPTDDISSSREIRALTTTLEVTREDLDAGGGSYKVKLKDLITSGSYDVVNPDYVIFTATAPLKKQIDLKVMYGRGYVPAERLDIVDKAVDEILVDACFSPVESVNYFVENTRVGQDTDLDRLVLEIVTDGRISPEEALSFATQINLTHLEVFNKVQTHSIVYDEGTSYNGTSDDELLDKLVLKIDEIELSVRSTNCLSGANIETIGELVLIPERRMLEFKNFGKKSLTEIKQKLHDMKLFLGMDLAAYGIDLDNVKEKMREMQEQRLVQSENFTNEEF